MQTKVVPETGNHFRIKDESEVMLDRYQTPLPQLADGAIAESPLDQREHEHFKACLPTWRDVLIAKLLRSTGLRVLELLRLEARHYQVAGTIFSILVRRSKRRRKKGGEYEQVYLPPSLGVEVRDYITGNQIGAESRVFSITDRQVRYVFAAAGQNGIGRPLHPHELRHLYVKTLIDGGVPVVAASKLVGHSDSKTTSFGIMTSQLKSAGQSKNGCHHKPSRRPTVVEANIDRLRRNRLRKERAYYELPTARQTAKCSETLLLATSKSGTLLLRRDQGEMAVL